MKKQYKYETLCQIDLDNFANETIDKIIKYFEKLKQSYPNHQNIMSKIEYDYDSHDWYICGERLETDEEYNRRLQIELKIKEKNKREKNRKKKETIRNI